MNKFGEIKNQKNMKKSQDPKPLATALQALDHTSSSLANFALNACLIEPSANDSGKI